MGVLTDEMLNLAHADDFGTSCDVDACSLIAGKSQLTVHGMAYSDAAALGETHLNV